MKLNYLRTAAEHCLGSVACHRHLPQKKSHGSFLQSFLLLAALLLTGSSASWASATYTTKVELSFLNSSFNASGNKQAASADGLTNAKISWSNIANETMEVDGNTYYKFNDDNAYINIAPYYPGVSAVFMPGDVVTVHMSTTANDVDGGFCIKTSGHAADGWQKITPNEDYAKSYTLTADDINDDGSITIYRLAWGNNLKYYSFEVTSKRHTVEFGSNNASWGTVTATANGKSLTSGEQVGDNTEVTFTAHPNSGYEFQRWSNNETSITRIWTVTADGNVTAYFMEKTNPFTVSCDWGGDGFIQVLSPTSANAGIAPFSVKAGGETVDKSNYTLSYTVKSGPISVTSDGKITVNSEDASVKGLVNGYSSPVDAYITVTANPNNASYTAGSVDLHVQIKAVTNGVVKLSPSEVRVGDYFDMTVERGTGFPDIKYYWTFPANTTNIYGYDGTAKVQTETTKDGVAVPYQFLATGPTSGKMDIYVRIESPNTATEYKGIYGNGVTIKPITVPTINQNGSDVIITYEEDFVNRKDEDVDAFLEYKIGDGAVQQTGFGNNASTFTLNNQPEGTVITVKSVVRFKKPDNPSEFVYAASNEFTYTVKKPLRKINVNGKDREYFVYVPENISGTVGVVVSLHGANCDYDNGRVDFDEIADQNQYDENKRFVVVYPRGLNHQEIWGGARSWDTFNEDGTDDVDFFKAIVNNLNQEFGGKFSVDDNRIYLAGFSNGGMMAYKAAHQAGDFFKAFASVGGFPVNESHLYHAGVQPTPFIHIHGENDNVVRIHKDDTKPEDAVYDVNTIIHNMTYRNGASFNPNGQSDGGNVIPSAYNNDTYVKSREIHNAEDGGAAYYYYEIKGMWHDCSRDLNGDGKDDLIAQTMWNFFNKDNITYKVAGVEKIDKTLKFRANDADQFWNFASIAGFTTYPNTAGTKTVFTYGDDTKTNENKNVYHSLQFKGVVGGTPHYLKLRINTTGAGDSDYFVIKLTQKGQSAPVFIRRYQATAGDGDYFVNFDALNGWNEYKLTVERSRADLDVRVNGVEFHSGSEVENEAFFPADLNNVLKGMNPIYQPVYGQSYDAVAKEYLPIATIPVPTEETPAADRTIEDVLAYTKNGNTTTLTSIPSSTTTDAGKLFINIAKSGKETTEQAEFKSKNAYVLGTGYSMNATNGIALSQNGPAGMPAYVAGSGDFPTNGVIAMKVQGTFDLTFLLYNALGDTPRKLKVYYTNDQLNGELKEWKNWDFTGTRNETNANGKNVLDLPVRMAQLGQDGTSTIFLTYEGAESDDNVWVKGIIAHRPNLDVTIGRTDKLRYKNGSPINSKNDKLTCFGENKPYQWNFGTSSFSAIDPKTGEEAKKINQFDGRTYIGGLGPNGEELKDHLLVYSDGAGDDKASFDGRPSNGRHKGFEDDLTDNNEHIEFNHPTKYSGTNTQGGKQVGFDGDRRSFYPILSNGLKVNVTGSGWFTIACSAPNGAVNMKVLSSTNGGNAFINLLREFRVEKSDDPKPETDWQTYRVYLKAHKEVGYKDAKGYVTGDSEGFWDGDQELSTLDPEDTQMSLYVVFDKIDGVTYKDGETAADAQLNIHYLQWINEMPADYVFQREENPKLLNSRQSIITEKGTAEAPGLYWQAGTTMTEGKKSFTSKTTSIENNQFDSAYNSADQEARANGKDSGDDSVSQNLGCQWNVAAKANSKAHSEADYKGTGDKEINYEVFNHVYSLNQAKTGAADERLEFALPMSGSFLRFMPMKNQFISANIVPQNNVVANIYVLDETGKPIPYCEDADTDNETNRIKITQEARERGWVSAADGMTWNNDEDKKYFTTNDGTTAVRIDFAALAGKEYFICSDNATISLARLQASGNSGRAAVEETTLALTDGTDNTSAINTAMNGTGRYIKSVKLNKRKFTAGNWAALVLPFSLNEKKLEDIFGVGTKCLHFTKVDKENNVTTLTHHFYNMVVAGRPVFICPTETVENPTFTDVTLQASTVTPTENEGFSFIGSFQNQTIKKNDLFLNASNGISYWNSETTGTYPSMRAFIKNNAGYNFPDGTSPTPVSAKFVNFFDLDDDEPGISTSIEAFFAEEFGENMVVVTKSTKVYDLNGRIVAMGADMNNLPAGIYIVNGKKFVVK